MKYINETMGPVLSVPDPGQPWKEKLIRNPFLDKASQIGSFEEYCRGHFQDTYLKEIRRMISDCTLPVGKFSRDVPEPDDVFVSEICVMSMQFGMDEYIYSQDNRLHQEYPPGYPFSIRMRAAIKAAITVSETWDGKTLSDSLTQWYQADGHVIFYPDRHEFFPVESISIYDKDTPPLENPLDENLAPVIGNEGLDRIAYRILDGFYHEALEKPTRVAAKKLAQRLGLKLMPAKLSDDYSRFGLLVMRDCCLMIDGKPTFVPARTILIDREACRRKRGGRTSWVIIHECIHFILHRPFFEAQRLYNEELACLCCGTETGLEKGSSLYWLEWQAEHLPPHLMIPAAIAPEFIGQEYLKLCRRFPQADETSILEKLIPVIADMFFTSKQSTGIRLGELGYAGTAYPVQQPSVPMVAESTPAYGNGPIYAVSLSDVCGSSKLRKILESGSYVYVDSRFCLNDNKYVCRDDNGLLHMNSYALAHERECCLPFWHRKQYSYNPGSFHMEEIVGTVIECGSRADVKKRTVGAAYPEMRKVIEGLPASVGGTLTAHMERLGCTVEALEEYSHVSERTIKNIRANNCPKLEMRYFIAVCIGLKLEAPYSLDLMRKTRFRFDASRESTMYLILLTSMYWAGIDACNEELIKNGLAPLTK